MAVGEIPPQMANFQTFFLKDLFFLSGLFFRHFAHCYFVLNFSLLAQKQDILVLRNTQNCSSVHSGMTGISLAELAIHNRCVLSTKTLPGITIFFIPVLESEAEIQSLHEKHFLDYNLPVT